MHLYFKVVLFLHFIYFFLFFLNFWVTLVNKIIQVSGTQFYSTSSIYRIVFITPSQVFLNHHLSPLFPPPPPPHRPPAITTLSSLSTSSFSLFLHCWWECRLVQPLWKAVWSYLKKFKRALPYEAIPFWKFI